MGDFNAKLGNGQLEEYIGPLGLGDFNERGEQLLEDCISGKHLKTPQIK